MKIVIWSECTTLFRRWYICDKIYREIVFCNIMKYVFILNLIQIDTVI